MKIKFLGAAREVTGSCTLLQVCGKNILIDCGMEQGKDMYENCELPQSPAEIDCVLLTHAHIDHSGRLPLLSAGGFCGAVYSTEATHKLCKIMLSDSAHIQEFEAQWRNRKAKRAGREQYVPLYTQQDVDAVLKLFSAHKYNEEFKISDGISVVFYDAGHLLGSSSIKITATENGKTESILFSGDIGNINRPLIRDPQFHGGADYVVIESTYGDREHGQAQKYVPALSDVLERTFKRGGNVVIPSFAIGRTQELLYAFRQIKQEKRLADFNDFVVYVDSPLAAAATQIYASDMMDYFDDEALSLVKQGINPIAFSDLELSLTSEQSKLINDDKRHKVIISASGMCDAGRIRHHLKHNLWRSDSTIVFVGYQAAGTPGRALVDGAKHIRLFGEEINVASEITVIAGSSGHADSEGLMNYMHTLSQKPKKVFVNHGEDSVCEIFAERLQREMEVDAVAPYNAAEYDLSSDSCIYEGNKHKLSGTEKVKAQSSAYDRLRAALSRLNIIAEKYKNSGDKNIVKLADRINDFCNKIK